MVWIQLYFTSLLYNTRCHAASSNHITRATQHYVHAHRFLNLLVHNFYIFFINIFFEALNLRTFSSLSQQSVSLKTRGIKGRISQVNSDLMRYLIHDSVLVTQSDANQHRLTLLFPCTDRQPTAALGWKAVKRKQLGLSLGSIGKESRWSRSDMRRCRFDLPPVIQASEPIQTQRTPLYVRKTDLKAYAFPKPILTLRVSDRNKNI